MKDKKIITFKEDYRGETYVAFAEDKTELYYIYWLIMSFKI